MPTKEYIRKYSIPLWYLDEEAPVPYIVEASNISDATSKLADRLDVDISDILNNMDEDSAGIYNPVKDEWVRYRPWWEEDKEPYEWENEINPDATNPTFEELKKSGWFVEPLEEEIDSGIIDFVKKINKLPYAATSSSCAGHTAEEWKARGMALPDDELNHAYLSVYVSSDRRRDFFAWLKEYVDMDGVDIQMDPVGIGKLYDPLVEGIEGGSGFERWWPTRDVTFTKDKVFSVNIVSKKLHLPLKARYGGFAMFKGNSKEGYYLSFNRDEIFKNLIASEGHFRNFNSLKEDSTGFLNCIVKHLADAEGHCDEAVSHALISENSETSKKFLELREEIKELRKWIQSSPISRDDGIKEIRKLRRSFEGFNPDYDVSKCETCGDSAEIMKDVTKILSELKNNSHTISAHEIDSEDFLVMEREMAEKVIIKLSEKYGVNPPELIISDECHEPMIGLYSNGQIMVCKTGVNLHVLAHEFWHHVQARNGMHMDEGEAEKFAIELFASPPHKGLYAFHNHSHNELKMSTVRDVGIGDWKDVGVIYGGDVLGFSTNYALEYLDTLRPEGYLGQPVSFWGDVLGSIGGFIGALYLEAPLNLLAALIGGYLAADLVDHIIRIATTAPLVARPTAVYTPPIRYTTPVAPVGVAVGRYAVVT